MTHIFISYSRQDEDFAQYLAESLKAKNFEVWLDIERLDVGEVWDEELENAVTDCYAFVIIMSANSKASKWVKNELGLAQELKKPIFPMKLSGDIWWNLKHLQAEDMTKGLEAKLSPRFLSQLKEAHTIKMDEPKANELLQNKSDAKTDNEQDKLLPFNDDANSQSRRGCFTKGEIINIIGIIVIPLLIFAFGTGLFFKVFPPATPTITPTITTVTLTDTTTPLPADTATPSATFSPTPCCTETPEPTLISDISFEDWLLLQDYEESSVLSQIAMNRRQFLATQSILALEDLDWCLNISGDSLSRELSIRGYNKDATLIVMVNDGDTELSQMINLIPNAEFTEFGFDYWYDTNNPAQKSYLVLILASENDLAIINECYR